MPASLDDAERVLKDDGPSAFEVGYSESSETISGWLVPYVNDGIPDPGRRFEVAIANARKGLAKSVPVELARDIAHLERLAKYRPLLDPPEPFIDRVAIGKRRHGAADALLKRMNFVNPPDAADGHVVLIADRTARLMSIESKGSLQVSTALGTDGGAKIDSFRDQYRFLSNFSPVVVELDGQAYPSVEHAYQAAKTMDPSVREEIRLTRRAGKAKKLGAGLPAPADWKRNKVGVMENLLRQKFANPRLRRLLLGTGEAELVEGNTWGDGFWGVRDGEGQNTLGRLLMKIRKEAREEEAKVSLGDSIA